MTDRVDSAGADVLIDERIQPIHVSTEYLGGYQSVTHVRDLPDLFHDEPHELGGKNSGPTALEATLAALNACSAMIMFVMRRELRFDLQSVRFETEGLIDVRRVEMKRTGKRYSEVEPITRHFQKVTQRVRIRTGEPEPRIALFQSEVERLCPLQALLRDAGVPLETVWEREEG
jgi:uncharacterized OsmC-like protein